MSPRVPALRPHANGTVAGWLHRRFVDGVAVLGPRTTVELASTAGRLAQRLRRRPRPDDVAEVFRGHAALAAFDPVRAAREISAFAYRNRALSAVARRQGVSAVTRLLDPTCLADLAVLRPPRPAAILVTWHLGPGCGISAAFDRLGIESLAVVRHPLAALDGCGAHVLAGGGEAERAAALWRAVRHLKDGGLVVIAADGLAGDRSRPVTFLGRRVLLARGPFVLARLSGAPLIPLVVGWTADGYIRVELGPTLNVGAAPSDGDAFETDAAAATAAWMEQRVLSSPTELRPHSIRLLRAAPRVQPDAGAKS